MDSTPPTLLEKLRLRDNQAWEQFHKLYCPRIWAKVHDILGGVRPPGDWSNDGHRLAADICQEVVFKVFQNLAAFDRQRDGSFRKWLDTIVRNTTLAELRRPGHRASDWPQEKLDQLCTQLQDPRQDFQVFTEEEHNRHLMGIALDWLRTQFPEEKVQVFLRLVTNAATPEEVARELGVSLSAVYLRKHRILKKLREYMDQYLGDFLD